MKFGTQNIFQMSLLSFWVCTGILGRMYTFWKELSTFFTPHHVNYRLLKEFFSLATILSLGKGQDEILIIYTGKLSKLGITVTFPKFILVQWHNHVFPATWQTEVRGSLEPTGSENSETLSVPCLNRRKREAGLVTIKSKMEIKPKILLGEEIKLASTLQKTVHETWR